MHENVFEEFFFLSGEYRDLNILSLLDGNHGTCVVEIFNLVTKAAVFNKDNKEGTLKIDFHPFICSGG